MNTKDLLPPALVKILLQWGFGGNRFRHGYSSFEEARSRSSGYDAQKITERVVNSSRLVRDGKAAFERDGVIFDDIQHSWPLLASLLATPRKDQRLRVLDWGGALGTSYRQNRNFLISAGIELQWVVIEQEHFVKIGEKEFTNKELSFSTHIGNHDPESFDVVLFASSICYAPDAEQILSEIKHLKPKRIVFDRTPEANGDKSLFGVQKVGGKIYKASYPIRSFGKGELESILKPEYQLVQRWVCDLQPDPQTTSVGYFFALKE